MTDPHRILIVDDEKQIGKSLGRLLSMEGLEFTYTDNAPGALIQVQAAKFPFSLIISDQRMPDMQGTEFLKLVKQISPDSIRFLLTAYSDMDTVTDSINQGAVHKYINKPWDNATLIRDIRDALERFEHHRENERLFNTAVQQNKKLFLLDRKLMESSRNHAASLEELELKITTLERRLERRMPSPPGSDAAPRDLEATFKAYLEDPPPETGPDQLLNDLHARCLADLFHQFNLLSNRKGFEMPLPELDH